MTRLDRPVFVLGAARSGTTLVAETVMARHPDVAYWSEPSFVWRYGNAYRLHDILTPEDATQPVKEYIRRRFRDFAADRNAARFLEKTPANSLRIPFVVRVFPDARIVHVIRDGRDAARSAADEWSGPGQKALEYPELRQGGRFRQAWSGLRTWLRLTERVDDLRGLFELPAYSGRLLGFLARHILQTDQIPWGPRFPGLQRIRVTFSVLETCALQWMVCAQAARSAGMGLREDQYLEVRYEQLVGHPEEEVSRILQFLELDADGELVTKLISGVQERSLPLWRDRLDNDEVAAIERLVGSTLEAFGYDLFNRTSTKCRKETTLT